MMAGACNDTKASTTGSILEGLMEARFPPVYICVALSFVSPSGKDRRGKERASTKKAKAD
jgi:hypothetical protein